MPGILFLIPNTLGENAPDEVIPQKVIETAKRLRHFIVEDVRQKLEGITGIGHVEVNLVFEPEWDKDLMSEEAKMELGMM